MEVCFLQWLKTNFSFILINQLKQKLEWQEENYLQGRK